MNITGVNGYFGYQAQSSVGQAEKAAARTIARKDFNGDDRLGPRELGARRELFARIDTNSNATVSQEEMLTALQKRIEERTGLTIDTPLDMDTLKSSLGTLLANVFADGPPNDVLTDTLRDNILSGGRELRAELRARFVNAFAVNMTANNGLPGTPDFYPGDLERTNSLLPFTASQSDGRLQLFGLLVGGLGTPEDEAEQLISLLESRQLDLLA